MTISGHVAKLRCSARPGTLRVAPALKNNAPPPYSRHINIILLLLLNVVCDMCYLLMNINNSYSHRVDLSGIVIHKWIPVHGIYFIQRFCPQIFAPATTAQPPLASRVQPSTKIWLQALRNNYLRSRYLSQ